MTTPKTDRIHWTAGTRLAVGALALMSIAGGAATLAQDQILPVVSTTYPTPTLMPSVVEEAQN